MTTLGEYLKSLDPHTKVSHVGDLMGDTPFTCTVKELLDMLDDEDLSLPVRVIGNSINLEYMSAWLPEFEVVE